MCAMTAKERKRRYLDKKHEEKYGPFTGDMRGKHGHHARGNANGRSRSRLPPLDPDRVRTRRRESVLKYPQKAKARRRLHYMVSKGLVPHPSTLLCYDCGAPATSYDHYDGYENPLQVQPVCWKCHSNRTRDRGELKGIPHRVGIGYSPERLGLFRWKNYGCVYQVHPHGPWAARLHNRRDDKFVPSRTEAIRHIRQCARQMPARERSAQ
jgi:hypothetical protein